MKKNCLLLIILLVSFTENYAQNIANARSQGIGSSVTVSGIITNGDELGPIRYIEDSSAGLAIYDPNNVVGVNRGDSITVTGNLIDYNGLLEIQPVTNLINHGSGYSITPQIKLDGILDVGLMVENSTKWKNINYKFLFFGLPSRFL